MDNTKTYIDLVFRNGLKDYEESPPPEVWENVKIVIDRKKKYMFFLRSAASIAIIVSIGILAYMWGHETSKENFSANVAAINEPVISPADVVIPPAIVQEKTETTVVAVINQKKEIETVVAPVADNLCVPDDTYAENSDVDISSEILVAETELIPEIQETLEINYDNIFSSEFQTFAYNNIYENDANVEDSRWSIMAMASPLYQSQFTTSSNELSRQIMNSDQGRSSYSGGVGVAYKINKRLSLQSGVYYLAMGQELGGVDAYGGFQQVNPTKGTDNFEVLTSNGTVHVNNPDIYLGSDNLPDRVVVKDNIYAPEFFDPNKAGLNYLSNSIFGDLSYLELPMILRYKAIDRKLGFSILGGMSYNFLVGNSVYAIGDGGKEFVGTIRGLYTLSSSLGMGMEYKLSRNFSFNVEPTLKYFLNTSNSNGIVGLHTYSFGVFSGMSYKF